MSSCCCTPYDLFVCTAVAVAGDFLGSTVLDNASAFPLCHFSVHNGVSTLVRLMVSL